MVWDCVILPFNLHPQTIIYFLILLWIMNIHLICSWSPCNSHCWRTSSHSHRKSLWISLLRPAVAGAGIGAAWQVWVQEEEMELLQWAGVGLFHPQSKWNPCRLSLCLTDWLYWFRIGEIQGQSAPSPPHSLSVTLPNGCRGKATTIEDSSELRKCLLTNFLDFNFESCC